MFNIKINLCGKKGSIHGNVVDDKSITAGLAAKTEFISVFTVDLKARTINEHLIRAKSIVTIDISPERPIHATTPQNDGQLQAYPVRLEYVIGTPPEHISVPSIKAERDSIEGLKNEPQSAKSEFITLRNGSLQYIVRTSGLNYVLIDWSHELSSR